MTIIIDGKKISENIKDNLKNKVNYIQNIHNIEPCLAVILVGENPASQIYVKNKKQTAELLGIKSISIILSENVDQNELLQTIRSLNDDEKVHGILLQLPLPKHLHSFEALIAINPKKDVDGFHPENIGLLAIGKGEMISCTPKGCMKLIHTIRKDLSGLNALVIGRSNIVGLPVAHLLLHENCTVQIAHSKTQNLKALCLNADIIVAAAGKMGLVTEDMISDTLRPIIIDVGIHRYFDEKENKNKITGDTNFEDILKSGKASAITPVPGGVGPMTIACLMENLIIAVENLTTR